MKKQTIIVVSLGNSGSGAVFDYLKNRNDIYAPFFGEEFRLFNDPQGIYTLYLNLYKNHGNNIYSFFFDEFEKYFRSLEQIKKTINGKKTSIFNKSFIKLTENYLKKIIYLEFNALPQFKRIQLNFFEKVNYLRHSNLLKKSINEYKYFKVRLPKTENIFIDQTRKYLSKVTNIDKKKTIILNQSINALNINEHQKFFNKPKIIIVTRDPRSIFSSMKQRNSFAFPGKDVKVFIKWYQNLINRLNNDVNPKNSLFVKYENFLNNFDHEKKRLCNFLKIKYSTNSKYDVKNSKKNLLKAKKLLTKSDLSLIKKELKQFLQW
tara:strand:+ start:226 stop:1185 length:960 start_codon:yes stop_codon:yes gene_type:complete